MRKYTFNENYFEKIDRANKAYFLGLLYTDGCVHIYSKKQTGISLLLQERDKQILNKFKKCIDSNYKLEHIIKNNNSKLRKYYNIRFHSYKMGNDLINLGCIPRKSLILKFPTKKIPKQFMRDFIRGLIDGDGCVHSQITGRHVNPQFKVDISGTLDICKGIYNKLKFILTFKKEPKIYKERNKNVYRFTMNGNQNITKLYHYLYDGAETFLERKEKKMREVLKLIPYSCRIK